MDIRYRLIGLFLIIALVQAGVVSHFGVRAAVPDLFLLLISWMALNQPFSESWKFALASGLFLDLFTIMPFGFTAILLIFFAWLLNFVISHFLDRDISGFMLVGYFIGSSLVFQGLRFGIFRILEIIGGTSETSIFLSVQTLFWYAFFALVLFYPIAALGSYLLGNYHEKKRSF